MGVTLSWRWRSPFSHLTQVFSSGQLPQVTLAFCLYGFFIEEMFSKRAGLTACQGQHTHGFNSIFFKRKMCVQGAYLSPGNYWAAITEFISLLTTFQELPTCDAVPDAMTSHPRVYLICSERLWVCVHTYVCVVLEVMMQAVGRRQECGSVRQQDSPPKVVWPWTSNLTSLGPGEFVAWKKIILPTNRPFL